MTECEYKEQPETFLVESDIHKFFEIDIIGRGKDALAEFNKNFGKNNIFLCMLDKFIETSNKH